MSRQTRDLLFRYGATIGGVVIAGLVSAACTPRYPFVAMLAVVVLTAALSSLGPAILALVLGCLVVLGIELVMGRSLELSEALLGASLFLSAGLAVLIAFAALRRSALRASTLAARYQQHCDDLRKRQEELRGSVRRLEGVVQEAQRRRNEFLASLAHELRNPLAPIRNALYILGLPGASGATLDKVRDMLDRQVHHMTHLVDDLLDVTRMHGGKLELRKEQVQLDVVVQHSLDLLRPLVEDRCLELSVSLPEEPLVLEADPARLEQVLVNLLHNAIKYTDPGGRVWLLATAKDGHVELCVRDTGIGIATDMLPDIFDLFVQMERRLYRSQGGLGIGLTLVRNLVELHGGTVQAHSAGLGQGSEFIVRLPAREAVPLRASRPKDNAVKTQPLNLLVVDDNVDAADSLAILLRLEGHEVRVAHDGPAAVKLVQAERPDMIFLDLGMPGMDGYQVARRLRRQPEYQDVFLIALTGWGQEEDQRRTHEAGFDLHLVKPVEPDSLKQLLANPPRAGRAEGVKPTPLASTPG